MTLKLIRDEALGRIGMLPYFRQYGISQCNVRGCTALASCAAVVDDTTDVGICEDHYQEAALKGEWAFTLDFPE